MPIEVVTCGDLAALAGPWHRLRQHDPERMVPGDDVLCHCWNGAYLGSHRPPEDTAPVECEILAPFPAGQEVVVRICCLCLPEFTEVLRTCGHEHDLHYWLLGQVADALRWRDQRRLDSSPVPCDMDVEAAAMDRMEEER